MAYNKNIWQDGDVITASGMNNMENGIESNDQKIGDLTSLDTTAKSNLVAAINELEAEVGDVETLLAAI